MIDSKCIDKTREKKILKFLEEEIGFENYGYALDRGLSRIRPVFLPLIDKFKNVKKILIGGTNGKGEVSESLAQILAFQSKNYCMWTSPHLLSIRERFQSNNEIISYDSLEQLIKETQDYLLSKKIKLSFYEFLFYVFLKFSLKKNPEFLILEVGLGGRLDAVNLFDADVAAIVSISRDHQEFLGNDLKSILMEKLGIARSKRVLVSSIREKYLRKILQNYSIENEIYSINLFDCGISKSHESYHQSNYSLAKLITSELGLKRNFPKEAELQKRNWTFKVNDREYYLSGSHNPAGITYLCKDLCLKKIQANIIIASFSQRPIGDIRTIIKTLLAYSNKNCKIILTEFEHFKSLGKSKLFEILNEFIDEQKSERLAYSVDWKRGVELIQDEKEQKILFTGSYYFISDILYDAYSSQGVFTGRSSIKSF